MRLITLCIDERGQWTPPKPHQHPPHFHLYHNLHIQIRLNYILISFLNIFKNFFGHAAFLSVFPGFFHDTFQIRHRLFSVFRRGFTGPALINPVICCRLSEDESQKICATSGGASSVMVSVFMSDQDGVSV